MAQTIKRKPGRPRKPGPRDSRGKLIKRGPGGKFISPTGPAKPFPSPETPPTAQPGPEAASGIPGEQTGSEAAAEAVLSQFGGGPQPGSEAGADRPTGLTEPDATDWRLLIQVANGALRSMAPDFQMSPEEETLIAQSLGVVIKKRFPSVAEYGPEAALFVALGSWIMRCYMQRAAKPTPYKSEPMPDAEPTETIVTAETHSETSEGDSPFKVE